MSVPARAGQRQTDHLIGNPQQIGGMLFSYLADGRAVRVPWPPVQLPDGSFITRVESDEAYPGVAPTFTGIGDSYDYDEEEPEYLPPARHYQRPRHIDWLYVILRASPFAIGLSILGVVGYVAYLHLGWTVAIILALCAIPLFPKLFGGGGGGCPGLHCPGPHGK